MLALAAIVTVSLPGPVLMRAQNGTAAGSSLLVPGCNAVRDVPGATELPDPNID